ncbi:AAA family ATPase [Empedobacter stercoris]|uniref:ATP-dependent nuclease n=1 Tax=Empedobacter stercoris TaxID=1628248 RepID=UPI0021AEB11A|nr:AAA family ATPase [Empedobacter stercoris]UWX67340.1 AAA family ATPase [Empedobacter stercoris]
MFISKIFIKNFKCIKELSIYPNEKFNVIIGENNQGKTTIFEALQTWYRCYQLYIRPNKTDFYVGNNLYLPYKDLNFLRLAKDTDLYNSTPNEALIGLTIVDTDISGSQVQFDLQFKINRPQSISNAYLRVLKYNNQQFLSFSTHLKTKHIKLDEAIFLYQTSPIAQVLAQEPFMNEGQVRKKIMRGKSQEVLRNKILLHRDLQQLEHQVSNVLGSEIKFKILNKNQKNKDEYINLQVLNQTKQFDLHLQGSGLIQISEIFATVDYLDSKLNILLIDEPDSHIHLALQKRLITNLKALSHNQSFIISHNDSFVNETDDGELFYLSQDTKLSKELKHIEDGDLIKKDFGSPILTLERLNNSDNIIFVEGKDDKKYITKILEKFVESDIITNKSEIKKCYYFHIRGKDNLGTKLEHNKRTLSQLFNDKKYVVVTDKDFTSIQKSNELNNTIKSKLGSTSESLCHDGYCIESTLFSDLNKLHQYLSFVTTLEIATIESNSYTILDNIINETKNVTSTRYQKLEQQFNSQKNNRPELSTTNLSEIIVDSTGNRDAIKYLMNKKTIREYVTSLEDSCNVTIIPNSTHLSDEDFCITLFLDYIEKIDIHNIIFNNHKNLIEKIYNAQY